MKRVTLSARFVARDDYRIGDCKTCPISVKSYDMSCLYGCDNSKSVCPLGFKSFNCPMEIVVDIKKPAIRCQDCEHFEDDNTSGWCNKFVVKVTSQDYCIYSKRR